MLDAVVLNIIVSLEVRLCRTYRMSLSIHRYMFARIVFILGRKRKSSARETCAANSRLTSGYILYKTHLNYVTIFINEGETKESSRAARFTSLPNWNANNSYLEKTLIYFNVHIYRTRARIPFSSRAHPFRTLEVII